MAQIRVPADQVFPVLQKNILVDGFHLVIDLERSHGVTLVDARDGREYLDCYSFFASQPVGHNHPKMEDEGFRESLMLAALSNPANSDLYSCEYAAFVETFRRVAVPDGFRYLFFVAGGALAVENAMKAAFDWKAQKNRAAGHSGGADKILHFREAFHGRTGYTMSVTNTDPIKVRDFPRFDWPRVSNPTITFPIQEEAVAQAARQAVAEIEAAFAADPRGIAAILMEPIQGEGGDNHFRPEFFRELRRLADEHEALLILDEVQTGLGTTGSMWAFQQLGVTPDLVAFGKKTQVCGIMSTRRIEEAPEHVFKVSSRINSTWGGNLVDMVRCARYLQIMEEDGLVQNAAEVGAYFLERLQALQKEFQTVTNARGRGFFLAFDLADGATRNRLRQACFDRGFATLASGSRSLRFRPSLVFSRADVDQAYGILREVLRELDG